MYWRTNLTISIPTWFDSYNVRIYNPSAKLVFQFQHGSIHTYTKGFQYFQNGLFQFQHGSIHTVKDFLKVVKIQIFQFQHGSIHTYTKGFQYFQNGLFQFQHGDLHNL